MDFVYILPSIQSTIGFLAPTINCIQQFPQLYKTWKTKRVHDLSFYSLSLILFTNILWLLHGMFIMDLPLLLSGGISIVINGTLMILYLVYKRKSVKV